MPQDEPTIGPPQRAETGGSTVQRVEALHTNANTDAELMSVWLKATATNSEKTERLYRRVGNRFIVDLAKAGVTLRTARLDDIQTALECFREKRARLSRKKHDQSES